MFAHKLLRGLDNKSRLLKLLDKICLHIIHLGYYKYMNERLEIVHEEVLFGGRELSIIFQNPCFEYRNIYIALYFALKANQTFLNFGAGPGNHKIFISRARTIDRGFSLHHNLLYLDDMSLSQFLQYTEPNLSYIAVANYFNNIIAIIEVMI